MEKEPKNSASAVSASPNQSNPEIPVQDAITSSSTPLEVLREVAIEVRAQVFHNKGFLKLDYFTIFWLFVGASIIGLVLETAFRFIQFGGIESRAGLVWGPFSPIYGVAAVVLTVFLNRFYHTHNLVIFLVSMVVGSTIEFCASYAMEALWGAIAWDYTGTFGSIGGRTNFAFGVMWGLLGMVWVRVILPFVKAVFAHINAKNIAVRILTAVMTVFMVANIVVTLMALDRVSQRANGIPPSTPVQQVFDEYFPDSYMHALFANMSVYGRGENPFEK